MLKKLARTVAFGALLAGLMLNQDLAAQDVDIISQRINGYRDLGSAFKNINDGLKDETPVAYVIQLFARQVSSASQMQYNWFPPGSGPGTGVKTAAKPDIWEHPADFKTLQDAFATEAAAFLDIANAGDVTKMRVQAKQLGEACANCHKRFRNEEKQ